MRTSLRKVTYRRCHPRTSRPIPSIILDGSYLADYGFRLGDYFLVEYDLNRIVITRREKPEK